jgi:hypothetical protein
MGQVIEVSDTLQTMYQKSISADPATSDTLLQEVRK